MVVCSSYQLLTALLGYVSRQDNWPINITFNLRTSKIFNYHFIQEELKVHMYLDVLLLNSWAFRGATNRGVLLLATLRYTKPGFFVKCKCSNSYSVPLLILHNRSHTNPNSSLFRPFNVAFEGSLSSGSWIIIPHIFLAFTKWCICTRSLFFHSHTSSLLLPRENTIFQAVVRH